MILYCPGEMQNYVYYGKDAPEIYWIHFTGAEVESLFQAHGLSPTKKYFITGIDPELYDAAALDGSTRWKNIFTITLPCIMPTVVLMLILQIGNIMTVGYEKIILMYSPGIYDVSDTLTTYAYRAGILDNKPYFSHGIDVVYSAVVTAAIRERVLASKPQPFVFDREAWEATIDY